MNIMLYALLDDNSPLNGKNSSVLLSSKTIIWYFTVEFYASLLLIVYNKPKQLNGSQIELINLNMDERKWISKFGVAEQQMKKKLNL